MSRFDDDDVLVDGVIFSKHGSEMCGGWAFCFARFGHPLVYSNRIFSTQLEAEAALHGYKLATEGRI